MPTCSIFYNLALKEIYYNLDEERTRQLFLDLLKRLVEMTDNDLDDEILTLVRIKLENPFIRKERQLT
jgi:hypothetical protein